MKSNAAVWFEIYVQNMPRAKKFYEAVFQRELKQLHSPISGLEMWQFEGDANSYGVPGALVKMQGVPSGGNSTLVYFGCKDCTVEAERVITHGGGIDRPKMAIGEYGFIVLAHDTEGNMIGLHSMS
ncbi:MAG: VOC family protein [Steroidobacteraceae bacterium]